MLTLKTSILVVLLSGALTVVGHAQGAIDRPVPPNAPSSAEPSTGPSAAAILADYRGSDQPYLGAIGSGEWHRSAFSARAQAAADLGHARARLAAARAEVARLVGEIKIEGAEHVDIGGEVRAARLIEAEWQRAVDTVSGYIAQIDTAIVMRGSERPEGSLVRQSRK